MNYRKFSLRSIIFILILFFSTSILHDLSAQACGPETVQLTLPDTITAEPGEQICFDVNVSGFDNMVLFFFVINFNSTVLQFDSADPLVSGLTGFTSGDITPPRAQDPDVIRVLWSHPNLSASSLPAGSPLLNLCFTVIGTPGNDGQVLFNDTGLGSPSEFLNDVNASFLPCNPNPGSGYIQVVPEPSEDPQLFVTAQCGSNSGADEGIAELKAFYGTPPYAIDHNGAITNGVDDQDIFLFTGLALGDHTFSVTDAMGRSSAPLTMTITNEPAFVISPTTLRNPNCPTQLNGRIALSVTGGKPFAGNEYFFDWGSDQIGLGQNELKNIGNGVYTVTVIDSLGCKQQEDYILQRDPITEASLAITDALCEDRANGAIDIAVQGGGPYTDGYEWTVERIQDDGSTVPIYTNNPPELNPSFRLLSTGDYVVVARDSVDRLQACPYVDTITISASRELMISLDESTSELNCPAGQIEAVVNLMSTDANLTTPINVQLVDVDGVIAYDDVATSDQLTLPCLPVGSYTVNLSDPEGCGNTQELTLIGNTIMLQDSVVHAPSCFGEVDGYISVEISTDNPPLVYSWSNGEEGTDLDSIGGLSGGSYTLTVTDATDAQQIFMFMIDEAEEFSVTIETDGLACPGTTTLLRAVPTGGSGDLSYEWSPNPNNQTGSVFSDAGEDTYTVIVTDQNGCTAIDSITLNAPTPPNFDLSNVNPPQCLGENSGTAVLQVFANGDYPGPFSFLSSTGLRGTINNFTVTNFPAGSGATNWIIYSDGVCTFDTVYVDIPEAQPFSIDQENSFIGEIPCFGGTATVNLEAMGASNLNYTWPDLNDATGSVQVGLSAGVYEVILSAGDCSSIDSIEVLEPDSITITVDSLTSNFALCGNDGNTAINLIATGGTPDYQINWINEAGQNISTGESAEDLTIGTYTIELLDANGCDATIDFTVTEPEPVIAVIGDISSPDCSGDLGYITIATATGGVGSYRYQVNTAPAIPIADTATVIPGEILVSVFDQNGCSWDSTVNITEPAQLSVSLGPDANVELGQDATITATINSDNAIDTVIWSPSVTDEMCVFDNCQEIRVTPVSTTTYDVIVRDVNGCEVTDDITLTTQRSSNIFIPNAISPDATIPGNAIFKVFASSGVSTVDYIRIFDRYGNLVHAEEGAQPIQLSGVGSWNGRFNGEALEAGVYVYVVQLSFLDGGAPEVRKGNVTLVR